MNIILEIDERFATKIDTDRLREAVWLTLHRSAPDAATSLQEADTVTVAVTDNETVQELNRQYRASDAPTDVLSFANTPDPEFPAAEPHHLGDIVIAYPVAERQAQNAGHTPQEEIILLAVHGALHLSGFEHDSAKGKEAMWAAQRQIMAEFGLVHVQPTEK